MDDPPPNTRPQVGDNPPYGTPYGGPPSFQPTTMSYKLPDHQSALSSQANTSSRSQTRLDMHSANQAIPQYLEQEQGTSAYHMSSVANALPDLGSPEESALSTASNTIPRTLSGVSSSAVAYQLGQNIQMPGQGSRNVQPYTTYPNFAPSSFHQSFIPQQSSQHGNYASFVGAQPRMSPSAPYHNYAHAPQYMYYSPPYGAQGQYSTGVAAPAAQPIFVRKTSLTNSTLSGQTFSGDYHHSDVVFTGDRSNLVNSHLVSGAMAPVQGAPFMPSSGMSRSGPTSSIPRGPPRKPRQSGHALWVGNLPPGTTVMALKDHFSRDATKDIESLFLISKSNCAFVNYKTEASCTAAMHRFHDSRFNGVRLVCRLRRSSAPASGIPTGPSAMMGGQQLSMSRSVTPKQDSGTGHLTEIDESFVPLEGTEDHKPLTDAKKKYFIVKSLTLQDLELSVRNGIWSTQSHNEDILNKAFRSTESVYLIFSANKSGEYFGYARMSSEILADEAQLVGSVAKVENVADVSDVPKSIPTPATEWAPKGRIIDDSARGTIFWEAEPIDVESNGDEEKKEDANTQTEADTSVVAQSWGKPFKIEWISTNRLPFYRTRGLRNPWNANREVKIARDGTELEPSVGERLVQMFHRLGPSTANAPPTTTLSAPGLSSLRPF